MGQCALCKENNEQIRLGSEMKIRRIEKNQDGDMDHATALQINKSYQPIIESKEQSPEHEQEVMIPPKEELSEEAQIMEAEIRIAQELERVIAKKMRIRRASVRRMSQMRDQDNIRKLVQDTEEARKAAEEKVRTEAEEKEKNLTQEKEEAEAAALAEYELLMKSQQVSKVVKYKVVSVTEDSEESEVSEAEAEVKEEVENDVQNIIIVEVPNSTKEQRISDEKKAAKIEEEQSTSDEDAAVKIAKQALAIKEEADKAIEHIIQEQKSIQEFQVDPRLVNKWEKEQNIEMTQEYLQKYIDEWLDTPKKNWELRKNFEIFKIWSRKKGNDVAPDFPLMHTQIQFPDCDANIIKDAQLRKRADWDYSNTVNEEVSGEWNNNNTQVVRTQPMSVAGLSPREFIEKKIWFESENGDIYVYTSAIPDELYPSKPPNLRCYTIMGLFRLRKQQEGYVLDCLTMFNMQISKWLQGLVSKVVIMSMEGWVNEFRQYVQETSEGKKFIQYDHKLRGKPKQKNQK